MCSPSPAAEPDSAHAIEETLLRHLLELLVNSPQVDRIESQLLVHPSGSHSAVFREAGFQLFRRLFMVQALTGPVEPAPGRPARRTGTASLARRGSDARGTADLRGLSRSSRQPHQRPVPLGSRLHALSQQHRALLRLRSLFRAGFARRWSHRTNREFVALVLGSRVSPESGHITQVCVHPDYRRRGMARMLLSVAAFHFMRQGASEISLTVTEANQQAIDLYLAEGYSCAHRFDAAVWQRDGIG